MLPSVGASLLANRGAAHVIPHTHHRRQASPHKNLNTLPPVGASLLANRGAAHVIPHTHNGWLASDVSRAVDIPPKGHDHKSLNL